uniref:cold shock domain-containing protein n=1 Tax=uncultured Acinetobacter sp. TaxID=165433 RepID=UPI0025832005
VYNENKGYGFIQREDHEKDLFFHISDFPYKQFPPRIGEKLKFRIVSENGRIKAENIIRLDFKIEDKQSPSYSKRQIRSQYKKRKPQEKSLNLLEFFIGVFIFLVFLAVLIPFLSGIYKRESLKIQAVVPVEKISSTATNSVSQYRCDGRVYCSEMKSYDEAVFFINNCSGTKMDGDGDGVPCESQF